MKTVEAYSNAGKKVSIIRCNSTSYMLVYPYYTNKPNGPTSSNNYFNRKDAVMAACSCRVRIAAAMLGISEQIIDEQDYEEIYDRNTALATLQAMQKMMVAA